MKTELLYGRTEHMTTEKLTGVSERIFNMSIPAQRYGVVVFDVILPTGNAGGLENSLEIVS